MMNEEELKLLLARAEMLVTEAKEVLREAHMNDKKEAIRLIDEAQILTARAEKNLERARRTLLIAGMLIGAGTAITVFNIIKLLMK